MRHLRAEPASLPEGVAPTPGHRISIGLHNVNVGELIRTGQVDVDVTGELTPVPALANTARPELQLLNDEDLTFAKSRLDAHSLHTVTAHFGRARDPLARALLWGAIWDMTHDGQISTGAFVDTVISGPGRRGGGRQSAQVVGELSGGHGLSE